MIGVALTVASVPLWKQLSLFDECRLRVEQALAALSAGASADPRHEMKLQAALGAALMPTVGASPGLAAAMTRVLALAEALEDAEYPLRALYGLWFFHSVRGRHHRALEVAQRFCTLAAHRSDPNDRLVGERLVGVEQHLLGDQHRARQHIQRVLEQYVPSNRRSHTIRFQFDLPVSARGYFARILWLLGFPNQAMRAAEAAVDEARKSAHAFTLSFALALAGCPIPLMVGDLAAAEHYAGMLLDHSKRHALPVWHAFGRCHQGMVAIKRGDIGTGLHCLQAALDEIGVAAIRLPHVGAAVNRISRAPRRGRRAYRANHRYARGDRGGNRPLRPD